MATPGTLPDTPNADGDNHPSNAFTSLSLSAGLNKMVHDISEAWKKLGVSESSSQDTPLANTVLASLTNGKSKWMAIATAMLAANATTQRVNGTTFSGNTTSASFATLQTLNITSVGGDILVAFSFFGTQTTLVPVYMGARIDGGSDVQLAAVSQATASGYLNLSGVCLFTGVSAGAHTVDIRWYRDTSGTLTAAGGRPFLVEFKK